jgi:hypothetical protein
MNRTCADTFDGRRARLKLIILDQAGRGGNENQI